MPAAPQDFALLSCNFPDLKLHEELRAPNLTAENFSRILKLAFEAARKEVHAFSPVKKDGICAHAAAHASKIHAPHDLPGILRSLKPSQLEGALQPFCKEDRDPEKIIEKKLPPLTDFAVSCFLSALFERAHPFQLEPSGTPQKKEFRFAASHSGWVLVRKVSLEAAERKEIMGCLVAIMESAGRKAASLPEYSQLMPKLESLLSRYPQRKSFAKLPAALEEAEAAGLLQMEDAFFPKYALYRTMAHFGYPPYPSSEMVGGAYPELKIPRPRGRLKKG